MGGRGSLRFTTQWTLKNLSNRIDAINAQVKAIDSEMNRIGQEAYDAGLEEGKQQRWNNDPEGWAQLDRIAAMAEYASETNRAELVKERRKLQQELDRIKAGQYTLFG